VIITNILDKNLGSTNKRPLITRGSTNKLLMSGYMTKNLNDRRLQCRMEMFVAG
jgi:hypothetical protein